MNNHQAADTMGAMFDQFLGGRPQTVQQKAAQEAKREAMLQDAVALLELSQHPAFATFKKRLEDFREGYALKPENFLMNANGEMVVNEGLVMTAAISRQTINDILEWFAICAKIVADEAARKSAMAKDQP